MTTAQRRARTNALSLAKLRGWGLRELAKEMSKHKQTKGNYFASTLRFTTHAQADHAAAALGIDVAELYKPLPGE